MPSINGTRIPYGTSRQVGVPPVSPRTTPNLVPAPPASPRTTPSHVPPASPRMTPSQGPPASPRAIPRPHHVHPASPRTTPNQSTQIPRPSAPEKVEVHQKDFGLKSSGIPTLGKRQTNPQPTPRLPTGRIQQGPAVNQSSQKGYTGSILLRNNAPKNEGAPPSPRIPVQKRTIPKPPTLRSDTAEVMAASKEEGKKAPPSGFQNKRTGIPSAIPVLPGTRKTPLAPSTIPRKTVPKPKQQPAALKPLKTKDETSCTKDSLRGMSTSQNPDDAENMSVSDTVVTIAPKDLSNYPSEDESDVDFLTNLKLKPRFEDAETLVATLANEGAKNDDCPSDARAVSADGGVLQSTPATVFNLAVSNTETFPEKEQPFPEEEFKDINGNHYGCLAKGEGGNVMEETSLTSDNEDKEYLPEFPEQLLQPLNGNQGAEPSWLQDFNEKAYEHEVNMEEDNLSRHISREEPPEFIESEDGIDELEHKEELLEDISRAGVKLVDSPTSLLIDEQVKPSISSPPTSSTSLNHNEGPGAACVETNGPSPSSPDECLDMDLSTSQPEKRGNFRDEDVTTVHTMDEFTEEAIEVDQTLHSNFSPEEELEVIKQDHFDDADELELETVIEPETENFEAIHTTDVGMKSVVLEDEEKPAMTERPGSTVNFEEPQFQRSQPSTPPAANVSPVQEPSENNDLNPPRMSRNRNHGQAISRTNNLINEPQPRQDLDRDAGDCVHEGAPLRVYVACSSDDTVESIELSPEERQQVEHVLRHSFDEFMSEATTEIRHEIAGIQSQADKIFDWGRALTYLLALAACFFFAYNAPDIWNFDIFKQSIIPPPPPPPPTPKGWFYWAYG